MENEKGMSPHITATKLTDLNLAHEACKSTFARTGRENTSISLEKLYGCEHSPIRTQVFYVKMENIPTFVSTHLVRHKIGVEHFVLSNRADRGGDFEANRWTPINHAMIINAQSLINMAGDRLCRQASKQTVAIMQMIKDAIERVDPELAAYMVPNCVRRGGVCKELRSCGRQIEFLEQAIETYPLFQKRSNQKAITYLANRFKEISED